MALPSRSSVALIAVLLLAAALRLFHLAEVPTGFHADEASNGWNAWCLAETGADEHGVRWPLLYTGAFGDNRPPAYVYLAAASIKLFGPTEWAVRLPAALAGIVAVALAYVAARGFVSKPWHALGIAALFAVDPTLVRLSRWGHESSLTPAVVLGCVAAWQWAGVLPSARSAAAWKTLSAGALTGLGCYVYGSVRIYLPALALMSLLVGWRRAARAPRPTLAFVLGGAIAIAPLAWAHLNDPAINARARATWIGRGSSGPAETAGRIAVRYVEHFSPAYLFSRQGEPAAAPAPGTWHLPALWGWFVLCAAVACAGNVWLRKTRWALWLALAVLLYPAGDLFFADGGPNVLRSLCGWWALAALAAVGGLTVPESRWITYSGPQAKDDMFRDMLRGTPEVGPPPPPSKVRLAVWAILLLATVGHDQWYLHAAPDPAADASRAADLRSAARLLRDKWRTADAVVFTTRNATFAYPVVLVELGMTPAEFRAAHPERGSDPAREGSDLLLRAGPLFFDFGTAKQAADLTATLARGPNRKSYYVLRPEEAANLPGGRTLASFQIGGKPSLVVMERDQ